MKPSDEPRELTLRAIGRMRTPFAERASAPRQPGAEAAAAGTIELFPASGIEHALRNMEAWSHVWVLFWFHRNPHFRPTVQPPRSSVRRGVFATRSPYRPNPLGLSALSLERVDGLCLHVRGVDMLDGTPVFDIKPYVPYTDAISDATSGWLGAAADPGPRFAVRWSELSQRQLEWLRERHGIELRAAVQQILCAGPEPHPYRRIKRHADHLRLAVKDWRFRFVVEGQTAVVEAVESGYRPGVIDAAARSGAAVEPALLPHCEFAREFS